MGFQVKGRKVMSSGGLKSSLAIREEGMIDAKLSDAGREGTIKRISKGGNVTTVRIRRIVGGAGGAVGERSFWWAIVILGVVAKRNIVIALERVMWAKALEGKLSEDKLLEGVVGRGKN